MEQREYEVKGFYSPVLDRSIVGIRYTENKPILSKWALEKALDGFEGGIYHLSSELFEGTPRGILRTPSCFYIGTTVPVTLLHQFSEYINSEN